MKTGSESIEATLRRRRIWSAEFVARMEDTRLPRCVIFAELVVGAGCVGGQEKEWMGCLLDDFRALAINADQWTTAAQDGGGWRRTAEQGVERFIAKLIAASKARVGLRHAVVRPNVTGRTKERMAQSKRVRAGSLALVDKPQVVRTCILRVDVELSFFGVTCILFYLVFVFLLSLESRPLAFSICMRLDSHTQLS